MADIWDSNAPSELARRRGRQHLSLSTTNSLKPFRRFSLPLSAARNPLMPIQHDTNASATIDDTPMSSMSNAQKSQLPLVNPKQVSPRPSNSYESLRRTSTSSQISSRRGSNATRRRRLEAARKSSAGSLLTDRRTSLPILHFRPVDHSTNPPQQSQLPNYDPSIYAQLNSFTFGAPPTAPPSRTSFPHPFDFSPPGTAHVRSAEDAEMSAEEVDEEDRKRGERAKLRALDDGSRRPSLPTNLPSSLESRRLSAFRNVDDMQIDELPEDKTQSQQVSPKPLPALPAQINSLPAQSRPSVVPINAWNPGPLDPQLAADAAATGYNLAFIMDQDVSPWQSPPIASTSAQSSLNVHDQTAAESSLLDRDDQIPSFLTQDGGAAFMMHPNFSTRSSIEDPFMRFVDKFDPVYKKNRYAWTFKQVPNSMIRKSRKKRSDRGGKSPPVGSPQSKGKEREMSPLPEATTTDSLQSKSSADTKEDGEPVDVLMWNCQNVGQYGLWPGKTSLSDHRRPSVLYGLSPEGLRRRGPAYLMHRHSRCNAFSIFQGYHVTGQKILASHAVLLACKHIQISYASTPENRSTRDKAPHEPYEDDPEVQKLQTHNLVDDEPTVFRTRARHRGHTVHTSEATRAPLESDSSRIPRTVSAKPAVDLTRTVPKAGPSSFATTAVDKSELAPFIEHDGTAATFSTLTPQPKMTPHAVAFDALDPTMAEHALTRASSTRFEWLRRAFGGPKSQPMTSYSRVVTGSGSGTSFTPATIETPYSPPWMLMQPQSAKQDEERIIRNLNDSFRAVGLIPLPKARPSITNLNARVKREEKKPKPSGILDDVPEDAMMMLIPLWVSEGSSQQGQTPLHIPMSERTYLLIYYVPFDVRSKAEEQAKQPPVGKKRTRQGRERERERSLQPIQASPATNDTHGKSAGAEISSSTSTSPRAKCKSFRVVARMLTYADVKESGMKLPRFGLAVDGTLSDALLGNPLYHAAGDSFSAIVAVCHGVDSGLELVTEGLDRLGLRKHSMPSAEEQQIALAAMEMDTAALAEEHAARQEPLTSVGKSVVEMIFAGCVSILDVGF